MTNPRINLLSIAIMCFTASAVLLVVLVSGCDRGYSTSGAVALRPNVQRALMNVQARGAEWVAGITNIVQTNRPPPPGVNFAGVNCPGEVVFFNTTLDSSVEHLEALIVHEAWEIQHGCDDYDTASGAVVACYREGRPHRVCKTRVEREFY